ncbi:MAG: prepilin-type N-terminal cleavage/methylation domain-containing protein [Arenimonas sp.]|jgi:prepilin-type N-terminal cleavage/methylation domain-containing protein
MNTPSIQRHARGFSLLEVLVAVVILSLGLLALASLQLSLIRSSADTKSQTTAMSLAKEKIESLDSYERLGGTDSSCTAPADPPADPSGTCYRAITDVGWATVGTVGGVSYSRRVTVERYVYDTNTGVYAGPLADTATDAAVKNTLSTALPGKEFKRIVVSVSWVDAAGATRQIDVEDAISGINPSDTLAVFDLSDVGGPRKAVSIITNPSADAGVIPIAIGNGTDTAATNPRPVVVSQGNNSTTVETRFDILTYAALTGDTAQAQSRVETAVIGCTCTLGSGTQTAYRPTYWNGFQYKEPVTVTGVPVSTAASSGVTQSDLCTSCCRDHQDPSGVAAPKYDPRRAAHPHFLNTDLVNAVTASGGAYNESCRLIRVDGIFRVAAEPFNDHFGLLATVGLGASTPTTTVANAVPSTGTGSVAELYQTFVINYLKQRFVNGTDYNTVLDATSVNGHSALQAPSSASINDTSDPQYLHARGLYIDHLHTDAIAAIASAKAACIAQSCTADETQTAVLKLLPFTSLNATELAIWASSNQAKIQISQMEDFSQTINDAMPVSGRATFNAGTSGDIITATTTIQRSSAGLAIAQDVFPDSAHADSGSVDLDDTQEFTIGTTSSGGGEPFTVVLTGADLLANMTLGSPAQVNFGTDLKSCTPDSSTITPYSCVTGSAFALGGSTNIKVGNYNRSATKTVQNSCTRPNPASNADDVTDMPYVLNFDVSSATVDSIAATVGTAQNPNLPGVSGEYTVITANPVNVNSTVTVGFSALSYKCPANWATFLNSSGDDSSMNPDNSNSSTVCIGSGSNKFPAWDTTSSFVNCWSGFTP